MFNLDDPRTVALLAAAGGLLTPVRGKGGAAFGQALSQGIQGGLLGHQQASVLKAKMAEEAQQLQMRNMAMARARDEEEGRQHFATGLQQFMDPGTPDVPFNDALGSGEGGMVPGRAPSFNQTGFAGFLARNKNTAAQALQFMPKKADLLTLKEGESVYDPVTGQVKFRNDAPAKQFAPPEMTALLEYLKNPNLDPRSKAAVEARIAKLNQGDKPDTPYYTPVYTPEGVHAFNNRTGTAGPVRGVDGATLVRSSDSPQLQANIAGAKKHGEAGSENRISQYEVATASYEGLPKIRETLDILKKGDAITGYGSEVLTNLARAQSKFVADKKAGKQVSDSQYLDALLGSDVFPMIKSLGIGAKGLDTPAEREFLKSVMTGTRAMDRDALIRLTEMRQNIMIRAVDKWNAKVRTGELDRFFVETGIPRGELGGGPLNTGGGNADPLGIRFR